MQPIIENKFSICLQVICMLDKISKNRQFMDLQIVWHHLDSYSLLYIICYSNISFLLLILLNSQYLLMNQSLKNVLLSYRNGFYHGQMKDNKRNGLGMLIMDTGVILVVNWKDDLAYGAGFCYLSSDEYGLLQFNRSQLEGPCLFRSGSQLLVMQFNKGRAVNKHLLLNYQQQQAKLLIYQNGNYQVIQSYPIQNMPQSQFIEKTIGIKINILSLADFLLQYFCNNAQTFQIKVLPNGNYLFRLLDKSSTLNLGFVFNKNEHLISYGIYNDEKLHGLGCKYENNIKYEGEFQNGILNGEGLKFSNGKYSYGRFENGNLVEAVFLEERSNASEQKLKELKRIYHIQSPRFHNAYITKRVLNFKGISQLSSMSSPIKDYMYTSTNNQKRQYTMVKGNHSMTLNLLLSGKEIRQSEGTPNRDNNYYDNNRIRSSSRQNNSSKLSNSETRFNNVQGNSNVSRKFNY